MSENFAKNTGSSRSFLLKISFLLLISVFSLLFFLGIMRAKNTQKSSVCENAAAYAGIIDDRIAEKVQEDGAAAPGDVLDEDLPFPSSLSTFAILKDGQVLSTAGYSPLSWKLVATVSELARPASPTAPGKPVYSFSDLGLPDYYFYYVPSRVDGLGYCYYEPAHTGWTLFRQSFFNLWGLVTLLPLAAALSVLSLLAASSKKAGNLSAGISALQKNNREMRQTGAWKPFRGKGRKYENLPDEGRKREEPQDGTRNYDGPQDEDRKVADSLSKGPKNIEPQSKDPKYEDAQNEDPQNADSKNHTCKNKKYALPQKGSSRNGSDDDSDVFGSRPYFSGIIIDYHNMSGTPVTPDILELFDQIIRENLSVNKILFQISSQQGSDCLQYYMNYHNYNLRVLCDSLKMNLYNAAPEYAINIFYSDAVSTCQEMKNELLYLHRQLRYSLLLGYNQRFSIRQIRAFEASPEKMDAAVASTIQNHLRTRAYEDLYGYLRRYKDTCVHFARPNTIQYSFSEMYRFAEESFSAVKLFFQENSFSHPMVQSSCSTVLRANPGFGHFCDYLISCIQSYREENQHMLSTRNEQIMNSIYMYIEQDLADANLSSIARKMQMTDSHLSRVFKKNTGTNFSEYLSDRKLEEAAKLLVQDNKIKVAEIADMLGYGNPTYFLSRFKAKYGVSPTAYRKQHLPETNVSG